MIKFDIKDIQTKMVDKYITHFKSILDEFLKNVITEDSEIKALSIGFEGVKYVILVDKSKLRLNYQHLTDRLPFFEDKVVVNSNNVFLIDPVKLTDSNLIDNLNNLSFFYGDNLMYKDEIDYDFFLEPKYKDLLKWV